MAALCAPSDAFAEGRIPHKSDLKARVNLLYRAYQKRDQETFQSLIHPQVLQCVPNLGTDFYESWERAGRLEVADWQIRSIQGREDPRTHPIEDCKGEPLRGDATALVAIGQTELKGAPVATWGVERRFWVHMDGQWYWVLPLTIEDEDKPETRFEKAKKAYLKGDYRAAEKHFREVAKDAPDHLLTRIYLGHSLYYQERFKEAIPEYEKAAQLNARTRQVGSTEERILTDNLGMAYGLSGQLGRAKELFESAIKKDPEYPLYYYNLACAYAELDSLEQALRNLRLAFERKGGFLKGESFPNPREDDSFARFLGNPEFERALVEMGFPPPGT